MYCTVTPMELEYMTVLFLPRFSALENMFSNPRAPDMALY